MKSFGQMCAGEDAEVYPKWCPAFERVIFKHGTVCLPEGFTGGKGIPTAAVIDVLPAI
jgi:hypothetical protein